MTMAGTIMRGDLKVSLNMADRCQLISAREDCFAIDSAISPVANQRLEPSSKALEPKIIRLCIGKGLKLVRISAILIFRSLSIW